MIIDGEAELQDASHLWGKTVPETELTPEAQQRAAALLNDEKDNQA